MRAKIAVSLPQKTFAAVEKKRRELRKSRSAVVAEALESWLAGGTLNEEERRYLAGYLRHPETERDSAALEASSSWGEWDEAP
jgi:metal-responsive CopG/Arc/MetJ family transcriptional regulator